MPESYEKALEAADITERWLNDVAAKGHWDYGVAYDVTERCARALIRHIRSIQKGPEAGNA